MTHPSDRHQRKLAARRDSPYTRDEHKWPFPVAAPPLPKKAKASLTDCPVEKMIETLENGKQS